MSVHAIEMNEVERRAFQDRETLPPAPQDCEQQAVTVEASSADGKVIVRIHCTVHHANDEAVHVTFSDGWRPMLRAIEMEPDSHAESWLWIEAVREWQRSR